MNVTFVAVFPSTHLTLRGEKVLEASGVPYRTVMKPRKISSDCGLAISLREVDMDRAAAALSADGCLPVRFLRLAGNGWEPLRELGEPGEVEAGKTEERSPGK